MRIAICDDDKQDREKIRQYVMEHGNNIPSVSFDISTYSSGEELLYAHHDGASFDLLFLDINMKDINGIEAALEIRKVNKYTLIFFISGFTQYVSAAFALNAFQFLIKPVKKDSFEREFRRALKKYLMTCKKYVIESNQRATTLEIKDILYIECSDHKIIVHIEHHIYEKYGKLNDEEVSLAPFGFLRTNQSYLVNMAYISEITQTDVILTNGEQIAISRRKRTDVMCHYNRYMLGLAIWKV